MAVAARRPAEEVVATEVALPRPVATVLAVGAFLKNTLCLTRGARALVSRDVGNLDTVDAVRDFDDTAERLLDRAGAPLAAVAHDLHPDFHSTRYAEALAVRLGIDAVAVQHHHAHVAAVMAEHGVEQPVLGLALDGFGLGAGNQSWGGELLEVGPAGYRRLGHLAPLLQPGGDRAAREPWRMGAAALHALGRGDEIAVRYADIAGAGVIARMLERGVNAPPTSSCGRLFDAACGLLGVKPVAAFEGEAPMELERLAVRPMVDPHGWRLDDGVLDMRPLLDRLTDVEAGEGAVEQPGPLLHLDIGETTEQRAHVEDTVVQPPAVRVDAWTHRQPLQLHRRLALERGDRLDPEQAAGGVEQPAATGGWRCVDPPLQHPRDHPGPRDMAVAVGDLAAAPQRV